MLMAQQFVGQFRRKRLLIALAIATVVLILTLAFRYIEEKSRIEQQAMDFADKAIMRFDRMFSPLDVSANNTLGLVGVPCRDVRFPLIEKISALQTVRAILLVDHVLLQLVLLRHMTHLLCRLHDLILCLLSLYPRHDLRLRSSGWSDPLLLLLLLLLKLAHLHLLQLLLGELLLLRLWLVLLIMHHRLRKALQTHLLMLLLSHLRRELLLLLVIELLLQLRRDLWLMLTDGVREDILDERIRLLGSDLVEMRSTGFRSHEAVELTRLVPSSSRVPR